MKISIVVPLFNEKESLPQLMESIDSVLNKMGCQWNVLFVDDGSRDGSFETLKELKNLYTEHLNVFRFSRNYGKSAALALGIEKADGDIIVTMDADLQDDPLAIPDMVSKLDEGFDMVSGWKRKRYDPISKTFPSKVWNGITSRIAGVKLHDFNCGFKAYKAEVAKSLDIYGDRHRYLPALAHWNGYSVTEIPVPHHARKFGKSKYGFGRIFNGIMDMLTLLFLRKYLRSPLHFFGVIGLILMMSGSAILGVFFVQWLVTGAMRVRPLVLLSMGAVIIGIQILSFGLLAEMLTHLSPKEKYLIKETIE